MKALGPLSYDAIVPRCEWAIVLEDTQLVECSIVTRKNRVELAESFGRSFTISIDTPVRLLCCSFLSCYRCTQSGHSILQASWKLSP